MKKAYEKIFKPILQAAKDKGEIEVVPQAYYGVLENGHKLSYAKGKGTSSKPAPCILRFSSRFTRNTVLRNRREHMPKPSTAEVAAGISKYQIFEDLTKSNFSLLKSMMDDERIHRAWTIDGKLRFIRKDDPSKKVTVVKEYSSTVDEILNSK